MRARLVDAPKRWAAEFDFHTPGDLRRGVYLAFRRYRAEFGARGLVVENELRARDRQDAENLAALRARRVAEWPPEKFAALWPDIERERVLWSRKRWEKQGAELLHPALPIHVAADRRTGQWMNCAQHIHWARTGSIPMWRPDYLVGPANQNWAGIFRGLERADWHARQLSQLCDWVVAQVTEPAAPPPRGRARLRLVINRGSDCGV